MRTVAAPLPARAASAAEQAFLPRHEFTGVFRQGNANFSKGAMQMFELLIASFSK
jgi:hypothetical protein